MFVLSDKLYQFMKKLVQVIIPACSSAYFALAEIWDLPGAEKITGTLAVVATFLGICLGISSNTYEKLGKAYGGTIVVSESPDGRKLYSLEVNGDPEEIEKLSSITFKVGSSDSVA